MGIYQQLELLDLELPAPPNPTATYSLFRNVGNQIIYTSGFGPDQPGKPNVHGKLGETVTLEQGQQAAGHCALNLLSALEAEIGDLNRVCRLIKLVVFVASTPDFIGQSYVAEGASQLFQKLLGPENGVAARSAVGVRVLPGNIPVEVEAIIELWPGFVDSSV